MPESFASVAQLVASETLAAFAGEPLTEVVVRPFPHVDGFSGGALALVEAAGKRQHTFVLKRARMEDDWIMQATHDTRVRAVVAWESGLLDRLPEGFEHGVLACAREGDEAAILMRDLRPAMFASGDEKISVADNQLLLRAMARFHGAFWGRTDLVNPAKGFGLLRDHVALLTPPVVRPLVGRGYGIPEMALEGWQLLADEAAPAVAGAIAQLLDDPGPLSEAMQRTPQTVRHSDWKLGNLGLTVGPNPRIVLIDWAGVGSGPGAFELAWYLAVNSARIPVSKEACIATYRAALTRELGGRFSERWWQPQLTLSLLAGFLMLGWQKALGAVTAEDEAVRQRERAEVAWWSERALKGVDCLASLS